MMDVPGRIGAGYFGEPSQPVNDDAIRPGDQVRAVEGSREPWQRQTGIAAELKSRGRIVVHWAASDWNDDVTTVHVDTLIKIPREVR